MKNAVPPGSIFFVEYSPYIHTQYFSISSSQAVAVNHQQCHTSASCLACLSSCTLDLTWGKIWFERFAHPAVKKILLSQPWSSKSSHLDIWWRWDIAGFCLIIIIAPASGKEQQESSVQPLTNSFSSWLTSPGGRQRSQRFEQNPGRFSRWG